MSRAAAAGNSALHPTGGQHVRRARKKGTKHSPVMADVARIAGVSAQTVSRVSNGEPNVREETRRRVIQVMREVGYRPNVAARALKRGRYNSVGVITFTLSTYGNMKTIDALSTTLAGRGFSTTLMVTSERTEKSVSGAYNRLVEEAVDAIVLLFEEGLIDSAEAEFPPGVPVLIVGSTRQELRMPTVDVDQDQGGVLATRHLLELGHRQICHVRGPRRGFAADKRERAWRRTLEDAGLRPGEVFPGDWSAESGYRAGTIIAGRPEITAVFAGNDSMAIGVIRALTEAGRRVPQEVSVMGFDDASDSAYVVPPLTTVSQNFETLGRLAPELVVDAVSSGSIALQHVLVPCSLVVRGSTAPAPH